MKILRYMRAWLDFPKNNWTVEDSVNRRYLSPFQLKALTPWQHASSVVLRKKLLVSNSCCFLQVTVGTFMARKFYERISAEIENYNVETNTFVWMTQLEPTLVSGNAGKGVNKVESALNWFISWVLREWRKTVSFLVGMRNTHDSGLRVQSLYPVFEASNRYHLLHRSLHQLRSMCFYWTRALIVAIR